MEKLPFQDHDTMKDTESFKLQDSLSTTMSSLRSQPQKRIMRDSDDQYSPHESMSQSSYSTTDGEDFSTHSRRKSMRLTYRETNLLQSTDLGKSFLCSPTLDDSQTSDAGSWVSPSGSFSFTNKAGPSDNSLGSLSDIILRYNNAKLDSLKDLVPFYEEDNAVSSPILHSPTGETTSSTPETSHDSKISDTKVQTEVVTESGREVSSIGLNGASFSHLSHLSETVKIENHSAVGSATNTITSSVASNFKIISQSKDFAAINKELEDPNNETITEDAKEKESSQSSADSKEDGDEHDGTLEGKLFSEDGLKTCKKNPGHSSFFSLTNLKVSDLPSEIQHEDSVTFLQCMSHLVVQITVNSTSCARSSDDPYYEYCGTDKPRNGSGFIASIDAKVIKFLCEKDNCPHSNNALDTSNSSFEESRETSSPFLNRVCSNMSTTSCKSTSSTESSQGNEKHYCYGGVNIRTNKHVIFDKSEANNAYVKFFFDSPDHKGVIHGHVAAIVGVNTNQDHVILHVMSHDKSLFNAIPLYMENAKSSYKEMVKSTIKAHQMNEHKHKHSWVAVLSHPHGVAKSVTLGRIVKENVRSTRVIKYYDADTCPGSSGGLVITPTLLRLQWPGAVHCCYDPKTKLNVTLDSRFPDLDNSEMNRINKNIVSQFSPSDNKFSFW